MIDQFKVMVGSLCCGVVVIVGVSQGDNVLLFGHNWQLLSKSIMHLLTRFLRSILRSGLLRANFQQLSLKFKTFVAEA